MNDGFIAVFVPTFRRPLSLLKTLDSLAEQDTTHPFRIVVADNDHENSEGAAHARAWAARNGWGGRMKVTTVPERGLSSCRNAGLAVAFEDPAVSAVAMIDDDAVAAPVWLEAIIAARKEYFSDVLCGPTIYEFSIPVPVTIAGASMFGVPWTTSGPVPMVRSSNNCTIDRRVWEAMAPTPFDTSFSRSGGEDTDFFARCKARGYSFAWCCEAQVHEPVPPDRCTEAWVLRRHRLSAANSARVDCRANGWLLAGAHQLALAGKEALSGLSKALSSDDLKRFKGRMRFHGILGRIDGMMGRKDEHY